MYFTKTLALTLLGFTAVTLAMPIADVAETQDACGRNAGRGQYRTCEKFRSERHGDRRELQNDRGRLNRDREKLDRDRARGRGQGQINRDWDRVNKDRGEVRGDKYELRHDTRRECATLWPKPDFCR